MFLRLKGAVHDAPLIGPVARSAARIVRKATFRGSAAYWEQRYHRGETSGPGSYGALAEFKAGVLNNLIEQYGIRSVVEFGCGDGSQLALARYPKYLGLDVSRTAIEVCIRRFADDGSKSFAWYDPHAFSDRAGFLRAELAISLDVIYHLVEDAVFDTHMRQLFAGASRLVVIYSSNSLDQPANPHVRHRRFTDWIDIHGQGWALRERIPNKYPLETYAKGGSAADFYIYVPHDSDVRASGTTAAKVADFE